MLIRFSFVNQYNTLEEDLLYIFNPLDGETFNDIKTEMTRQISKYVPSVEFRDVTIYNNEAAENGIIVMVEYGVKNGNKLEIKTVAVKL